MNENNTNDISNNENTENIEEKNCENKQSSCFISKCFENHCWKQCVGMAIVAFIGAFLGAYFVANQVAINNNRHQEIYEVPHTHFDRDVDNMFRHQLQMMNNMQNMTERMIQFSDFDIQENHINDFFNDKNTNPFTVTREQYPMYIKSAVTKDNIYKIIIGLKPFNKNPENIKYSVKGNRVSVSGEATINEDNYHNTISFKQSFLMPQKANEKNISQKVKGNLLIISIPMED